MAAKRSGLGRGIGALIPTSDEAKARPVDVFFPQSEAKEGSDDLAAVPGLTLAHISPDDVAPNQVQPRQEFREDDLAELVQSIRECGVLQPIVVRPQASGSKKYELIMGERRLRACKELGLAAIPAVVKETADEDMLRDALLENLHRSQLNPLEEASAYQQLLADFGITQDELATRIGRSRPQITNTLRLLRLPVGIQARVASGVLSAGHARAILAAGNQEAMQRLADRIVNEDLSVRAAESVASRMGGKKTLTPLKPKAGKHQAHLNDVAERLADRLNTRVKISLGAKKGQVTIDFSSVHDLNRILDELGETEYGATA